MSPEYRNLNGTCRYRSVMTPEIILFLFLSLLHCIPHELQSSESTRSNEGRKNEIIHSPLDGRPVAASKCTLWEGTRIEFATAGYSGCSGCSLWFTAPFHALHIHMAWTNALGFTAVLGIVWLLRKEFIETVNRRDIGLSVWLPACLPSSSKCWLSHCTVKWLIEHTIYNT